MDRRASHDEQPPSPLSAHTDVFDDEFEIESPGHDRIGTTDGFSPNSSTHTSERPENNAREFSHDGQHAFSKRNEETPREFVRSSLAKGSNTRNSIPRARDGSYYQPDASESPRPVNAAQALMHRASVSSAGSFATTARSSTPMGGPSHPYTMYPQNTNLARSPSNMTSSTPRSPQRSNSTQQPTHPYTMYPQNVVEDAETPAPEHLQSTIPVGFPGLNTGYHRRIGPDGEEQDIVGPDGHTEQLPPYSRYPDENQKAFPIVAPVSSSTRVDAPPLPQGQAQSNESNTNQPSPSGVNLIPLEEDRSSNDNQRANRASIRSTTSNSAESSGQSSADRKKKWAEKNWQEKRRTRICGRVPLWLIILMAGLIIVFAIILGAAIGSIFTRAKKAEEKATSAPADNTVTVTQYDTILYDASRISKPTDFPPPPTGTFEVFLRQPATPTPNPGCLPRSGEQVAWNCDISGLPLLLEIFTDQLDNGASLGPSPTTGDDRDIQYGVQPPELSTEEMYLVEDRDVAQGYGPAFHFQSSYNKVVFLKQDAFTDSQRLRARRFENPGLDNNYETQRETLSNGAMPWKCSWPETLIELYMYTNSTSKYGTTSSAAVAAAPTPTSATPVRRRGAEMIWARPTPVVVSRDGEILPPFPRLLKIEERRLPNSPAPMCQQMQMLENGTLSTAQIEGQPIIKYLLEEDPSIYDLMAADDIPDGTPNRVKRHDPDDGCHCQWVME